jgi:hypothetical protein
MRRQARCLPAWLEAFRLTLVTVSGGAVDGAILQGLAALRGQVLIGGTAASAMGWRRAS